METNHHSHKKTNLYRRLQENLDMMPVGFPATKSGSEIRLLEYLFTPLQAEVVFLLSAVAESISRISRRSKNRYLSEQFKTILDQMVDQGLIRR